MNEERENIEPAESEADTLDYDAPDGGDIEVKQDSYRRVMFGQIVDGLLPRRPGPNALLDDELEELNKAALSDPAAPEVDAPKDQPSAWRIIFLIVLIAFALAVVFWRK
jgi:hypothetical protein